MLKRVLKNKNTARENNPCGFILSFWNEVIESKK